MKELGFATVYSIELVICKTFSTISFKARTYYSAFPVVNRTVVVISVFFSFVFVLIFPCLRIIPFCVSLCKKVVMMHSMEIIGLGHSRYSDI